MIEQVFGIVRGDSLFDFVKNHLIVFIVAVRLFRDDLPCDFRDFVLVVTVNFDAGIAIAGVFAVEIRTACGNGGDQWQQQTNCCVKLAKFFVTIKGKVQVCTLKVCPAMTFAVENAVISLVNVEAIVRPELHFCRVHERMAGAWQKHRVDLFELLVCPANLVEESLAKSVKSGLGVCALEFQHVAHEFVRKSDVIVFNI